MANNSASGGNIKGRKNKGPVFWGIVITVFLLVSGGGYALMDYIISGLPSLEQLENPKQSLASNVFSADGELIGQFFKQNRVEVSLDSIPDHLVKALIATEDRKFFSHWGVDMERFVKGLLKTIFLFKKEGASTITQQLAKNLYDFKSGSESVFDTIIRKIREWITAVQIEKTYTKREILEMYFNNSYFGNGAYGISSAAEIYFNKSANELTIPEAALFIAVLKGPGYYDPVKNYNNALQRRNLVMYNMVKVDFLSEADYEVLKKEPIKLTGVKIQRGLKSTIAPHFIEYVRRQMEKLSEKYKFNIYEDGLTIHTSLDSRMQLIANKVAMEHLDNFQNQFDKFWNWNKYKNLQNDLVDKAIKNRRDYRNASKDDRKKLYASLSKNKDFVDSVKKSAQQIEVGFVVLNVKDGQILTMLGGRDLSFNYGLNHTTQIKRQPGSSFKPIIYTVAIDNGLYPAYPMLNQPFDYNGWSPKNFDFETSGFMTLRDALRNSINIVTARLIIEDYVELWKVQLFAKKMGIQSKIEPVPAISLGTSEVSPIELTSAFATLANRGIYNEPYAILRIEDKNGILIDSFSPRSSEAISEETAYIVSDMMRSVVDEGTAIRTRSIHKFLRPAAGKTGTTSDYADAWFVGFTPQIAGGVWVGFDDRRITFTGSYGQGAKAALPIWAQFMHDYYAEIDMPVAYFEPPSSGNVVSVSFCRESIYDLGQPRLTSDECRSGSLTDIINIKDIPPTFSAKRDRKIRVFDKYQIKDTLAHEAQEID